MLWHSWHFFRMEPDKPWVKAVIPSPVSYHCVCWNLWDEATVIYIILQKLTVRSSGTKPTLSPAWCSCQGLHCKPQVPESYPSVADHCATVCSHPEMHRLNYLNSIIAFHPRIWGLTAILPAESNPFNNRIASLGSINTMGQKSMVCKLYNGTWETSWHKRH